MKEKRTDIIEFIQEAVLKDGNLLRKARAAVDSYRYVLLSEKPVIFAFLGEHGDHLIVGGIYCTCQSFQSSMLKGKPYCYHIIGSWLALSEEKYHDISKKISKKILLKIIDEILEEEFSPTLRRVLFKDQDHL